MKLVTLILAALFSGSLMAKSLPGDYLIKIQPDVHASAVKNLTTTLPLGTKIKDMGFAGWLHVTLPQQEVSAFSARILGQMPGVLVVEPNKIIRLNSKFKINDPQLAAEIAARLQNPGPSGIFDPAPTDNPEIPAAGSGGSGADTLFNKQWGMNQIGVQDAWQFGKGNTDMVVGVIDTGVDYTHEDLVDNMWRNPGEAGALANNGIDDDKNGYIDDVVGWDFAVNDNKPYDMSGTMMDILLQGANPGHGTHCAGNVAARGDNGKGIAGVAPNVRIMALRFLTEKGQGTIAGGIEAIKYGVDNGAKVLSNSWGSEGDGGDSDPDTQALKEVITYAQERGVLFIAAAGNGHQGVGYDNDSDAKPAYPASYPHENIISVAAMNEAGEFGSFSNWGRNTVDLGAPGVKVFSTVVQSEKYTDTLIDIPGVLTATWDGTSMACPHVAGAAALYWSQNPGKSWQDVKNAILSSTKKTAVLNGKTVSGGMLDVRALSRF